MTSSAMMYEATRRVETSARTFTIVEHLSRTGPSRVSTIAADLEMTKGIVHNHLSTLRELGYVQKVGEQYELSAKFLHVGHRVRTNSPLYQTAHTLCGSFATRIETGVVLYAQAGTDVVVIDTHGLPASVDLDVGTAQPLPASLAGIVLLVESTAVEPTTDSPYDIDSLASQLEADGLVTGRLSASGSIRACSVPITTDTGGCLGALSVIRPTVDDERDAAICESVGVLRDQIERRQSGSDSTERSFATEKHAWIDS